MPEVKLWSALRRHADGAEQVTVDGETVGEVLDALAAAYPGMGELLADRVSVAVNGRIISNARTEPIPPGAEVFVMQKIKGG